MANETAFEDYVRGPCDHLRVRTTPIGSWVPGFVALLLCSACIRTEPRAGAMVAVDASGLTDACAMSGAAVPRDVFCSDNDQCLAVMAPFAPSGTLFETCISSVCANAEHCVLGLEGGGSCTCGSRNEACSGATPLCMRREGDTEAHCVAACR